MNIDLAHIKMNVKAKLIGLLSIIVLFDFSCTNVSDNSSTNERQIFETSAENYVAGLDNVRISYTKHSEGDNILLFVHGWSCDQTYWKEQIDFFKSDYQVITTDLAGHGLSTIGTRTGWTIKAYAQDMLALINNLSFKSISLVGHSLGSMVVLDAVKELSNDNTKVVCVDYLKTPLLSLPREAVTQLMTPFETNFKSAINDFVSPMFNDDADTSIRNWVIEDMGNANPHVAINSSIDLVSRDFNSTFEALVTKDIPRFIINSDRRDTDLNHYKDSLGFVIATIPDANHFLMLEKPIAFNNELKKALTSNYR